MQHSTCKHISRAIGQVTEDSRLATNSGGTPSHREAGQSTGSAGLGPAAVTRMAFAAAAGGDFNPGIVKKVSLAHTWSDTINPTGWMLSEK